MKLAKPHWLGISFGILLFIVAVFFFFTNEEKNLFVFLLVLGIASIAFPFVIELTLQNKKEQEISQMFLEFSRNLAESVATGTPISKSIVNMSRKNYGALSPYIIKLGNQISLGIPLSKAMQNFAREVNNKVVTRAVGMISEAERAGGEIDYILESVAKSIAEIEKLKEERKAAISSLVVQGYIIFFIFIGTMLVMEYKILPLALDIQGISEQGATGFGFAQGTAKEISRDSLGNLFLYLLIAQGFFTGLAIGKLAEGSIKAGIKHSFIMAISAVLISTGIRVIQF